jgi:hypothetical protein
VADRDEEARMPKQFKGEIKLDVRESTPDWDAVKRARQLQLL